MIKPDKEQTKARSKGSKRAQWSNLNKPDATRFSDPDYMARLALPKLMIDEVPPLEGEVR